MRNNLIIIILVLLLSFGSIFFEIYIDNLTQEFEQKIENCQSSEEIKNITEEWNKRSSILELMIDHDEIDLLNEHLWSMQVEIDADPDDFKRLKKLAIESLKHISERNRLSLENIL